MIAEVQIYRDEVRALQKDSDGMEAASDTMYMERERDEKGGTSAVTKARTNCDKKKAKDARAVSFTGSGGIAMWWAIATCGRS